MKDRVREIRGVTGGKELYCIDSISATDVYKRQQEAFARLLSQCAYYQRDAASAARMTELAALLVTNVPVRQLTCRADGDAVRTLEEELRRS